VNKYCTEIKGISFFTKLKAKSFYIFKIQFVNEAFIEVTLIEIFCF